MKRRLRKKKRVGEFRELGFRFVASLPDVPFGGDAEVLTRFDSFLRANGFASWSFIGTGEWEFFVWRRRHPGLTSDEDRVLVMNWLKTEPMIGGADMSAIFDIWGENDDGSQDDA